jgi:hypothetical protein
LGRLKSCKFLKLSRPFATSVRFLGNWVPCSNFALQMYESSKINWASRLFDKTDLLFLDLIKQ